MAGKPRLDSEDCGVLQLPQTMFEQPYQGTVVSILPKVERSLMVRKK
jgi:hypothetical protein